MKVTKKKYESPHMEVFELKHQPQLLQASGGEYPEYPDGGDI